MKPYALLILALFTFSLYAKDNPKKETSPSDFKRFQIGINISPDVCFRTLKNVSAGSIGDYIIKIRKEDEIVKPSYTAGLNVAFNIKKFVGLETGVQYSNKGYQTKMEDLEFAYPNPNNPNKAKFIYNFHCIDIPIKANFTIGKKKVRFFTSVGLTTNIFIKATSTGVLVYSNHTKRETIPISYNYKKVNISPLISVGIDYKINSRMNLRVEPTFRYGVLKLMDTPITTYLYSGGLNISYYFGL